MTTEKDDLKRAWERDYFVETMLMRTRFNRSWFAKRDGKIVLPWHCQHKEGACSDCAPLFTPEVVAYIKRASEF